VRDNTRTRSAGVVAALLAGALCVGCSTDDGTVSLEMRIVQETPADSLTEITMTIWNGQKTYYAHSQVLLTEGDVTSAMAVKENGAPAMKLIFTGEARAKLFRVTRQNVGRRLGIIIDGKLQCAPLIDAPIATGIVKVTGHMLEPAAKRYSRALTHAKV